MEAITAHRVTYGMSVLYRDTEKNGSYHVG